MFEIVEAVAGVLEGVFGTADAVRRGGWVVLFWGFLALISMGLVIACGFGVFMLVGLLARIGTGIVGLISVMFFHLSMNAGRWRN